MLPTPCIVLPSVAAQALSVHPYSHYRASICNTPPPLRSTRTVRTFRDSFVCFRLVVPNKKKIRALPLPGSSISPLSCYSHPCYLYSFVSLFPFDASSHNHTIPDLHFRFHIFTYRACPQLHSSQDSRPLGIGVLLIVSLTWRLDKLSLPSPLGFSSCKLRYRRLYKIRRMLEMWISRSNLSKVWRLFKLCLGLR